MVMEVLFVFVSLCFKVKLAGVLTVSVLMNFLLLRDGLRDKKIAMYLSVQSVKTVKPI
jgi:hypothetical protein